MSSLIGMSWGLLHRCGVPEYLSYPMELDRVAAAAGNLPITTKKSPLAWLDTVYSQLQQLQSHKAQTRPNCGSNLTLDRQYS